MSDYRTQQQADALWRAIEANVDKRIAEALARQSGVIPGGPYTSFTVRPNGLIDWAGAGGGAGGFALLAFQRASSTQSVGSSAHVQYSTSVINVDGCVSTSGGYWEFTAPADGYYLFFANIRFVEVSSGWSGGHQATLYLTVNGGPSLHIGLLDDPQNDTRNNIIRGFAATYADADDVITVKLEQTSGTTMTLGSGFGEYVMAISTGVA